MLKLILLALATISSSQDVYNLRIHEGAERGSRMTMAIDFQRRIEETKNCFGQLDTDVSWIEYRTSKDAFYTTSSIAGIDAKNAPELNGSLHFLCPGNKMFELRFQVRVTRVNHHPPTFKHTTHRFYVPISLSAGARIGQMEVIDNDPVIYNSERRLSFTKEQRILDILADGSLVLKQSIADKVPYRPIRMEVLAIDYGSPQLYSTAELVVIPVTVSQARELRVNVATAEYQIFEWEAPEHGVAEKFRLAIREGDKVVYEEEVEGTERILLTKVQMSSKAGNYSYQLIAVDISGETPSVWHHFGVFHKELSCPGECSGGGVPLCYYGSFNHLEQFTGNEGGYCRCFPGFTGMACGTKEECEEEKTIDAYGGLDWRMANAKETITVPCPYNVPSERKSVQRRCAYDRSTQRTQWMQHYETDVCKTQASVLTHLGMLGAFAASANSVSTVHTVARFMRDLLLVPSFANNQTLTAHFDQKIAEEALRVLNAVTNVNLDTLQGNTSLAKMEMINVLDEFVKRLPVPFSLMSPDGGLQMNAIHWIRLAENLETVVGRSCRVKLPMTSGDHVVRSVCTSNATLYEYIDPRSPTLVLSVDSDEPLRSAARLQFQLKVPNAKENYTCVFFDENEGGWSTRGLRLIHANLHGFVKCETTHFGTFSIMPERFFQMETSVLETVSSVLPTVTTFIALICSVFLLFMAAIQKNRSIDLALLVYLFFVFMLHVVHLVMLVAPQIGDPLPLAASLHLVLQFSVLSLSAMLLLVVFSIRNHIIAGDPPKENVNDQCCSRPCAVFLLGLVIPGMLTFTTYSFTDEYDNELRRILERVDWLFILNFLSPSVILMAMTFAYATWNVYLASHTKSHQRGSSRLLSVQPASNASVTAMILVVLITADLVLFVFHDGSPFATLAFCCVQLVYSCIAFLFAGYIFRMRYLEERDLHEGSTRSLERRRDISRALLEHVDAKDGSVVHSESGVFLNAPNIYERTPMVSIV